MEIKVLMENLHHYYLAKKNTKFASKFRRLKTMTPIGIEKLLFEEKTYKIIGACMSVHKGLGAGFLESVIMKLSRRNLKFRKYRLNQKEIDGVL